jgi:hypothetical protein
MTNDEARPCSALVKLLPNHRAHDARHLIQRWRMLARESGMPGADAVRGGRLPVIAIESAAAQKGMLRGLSFHPACMEMSRAAAWGLLAWAEKHVVS